MSNYTEILNIVEVDCELNETIDADNLNKFIVDLSNSLENRIKALNMFYEKEGESTIEVINKLIMLYELSGTSSLRKFLFAICEKSILNPLLKSIVAKGLCSHNPDDELGYIAIDMIYPNMGNDIGTPYKVDFIKLLMKNNSYKIQSRNHFCDIINNLDIDCEYRYKIILNLEKPQFDYFIKEGLLEFLKNSKNMTLYRILASQNLFQNFELSEERSMIEDIILCFANDINLDYNLRADATDVLLQLGSDNVKNIAKTIIMNLGCIGIRKPKTIYQNAQNVHSKEIEDSIKQALEYLQTFGILKVEGKEINFDYVESQIVKMLNENNKEKVKIALNRIYLDRALYSAYNCTLENILLRVWTFICGHKDEIEMKNRLLEELTEMAGTCSTGFATRLINTISGFGDFSIKISWRDQISGNFTGRLNARIRDMDNLSIQEKILEEMTMETSDYNSRKRFLKFLRTNMLSIREELYDEFKEHISDTDFDLYFRGAISKYEMGDYI
jgi:hypothetical protein